MNPFRFVLPFVLPFVFLAMSCVSDYETPAQIEQTEMGLDVAIHASVDVSVDQPDEGSAFAQIGRAHV